MHRWRSWPSLEAQSLFVETKEKAPIHGTYVLARLNFSKVIFNKVITR